jgi:hypothetical protein
MAEEVNEEEEEKKFFYCEACGIQLLKPEDHGGGDEKNTWCKDCCNEDGSHKSREEVKKNVIKIITGHDAYATMGERITEEEADKLAEEYMKKMPAWEVKEEKKED